MDWTSFLFGALSGIVAIFALFASGAIWWMRPYLKAARSRVNQTTVDEEDSGDIQARVMAHLWEKQSGEHGWGGNNPWSRITKKPKG